MKEPIVVSHIPRSVFAQWAVWYSLRSLIRVPIAVMVANIGVEDRRTGLVLLDRLIVPFRTDADVFQSVEALCVLVVFRHDVDASFGHFALSVNVEEEGKEG
jgi:hypothetical protein